MIWVFAFMGTILLECTLVTGLTFKTTNVAAANALNTSEYLELRNGVQENIGQSRVVFSDDTSELIESFDLVFDMLLEDDETFLDFANITSLYTLVDRQRPFYVAQSPSLLTDEYTQEQYLEQIKEYKIPLVIMGETESGYIAQLYGIQHSVRYYKVAEHIYQNYRPLLKFGEFSIWCMKENYDEYVDVVRNNNLKEFVVIDYGYDETIVELDENAETVEVYSYKHENDLGQTAYIWANFDDKSASNNTVLDSLEMIDRNSFIFAGSQSVDRQTGNYILFEVSNSSDAIVEMDIKLEDSEKTQFSYKYTFDILPGDNKYIIRVSSDYFWYASNINKITFETVDNIGVQNLSVLKGD